MRYVLNSYGRGAIEWFISFHGKYEYLNRGNEHIYFELAEHLVNTHDWFYGQFVPVLVLSDDNSRHGEATMTLIREHFDWEI